MDIQNIFFRYQKLFPGIQNNYFRYLEKTETANSGCRGNKYLEKEAWTASWRKREAAELDEDKCFTASDKA